MSIIKTGFSILALVCLSGCDTTVTPDEWERAVALCKNNGGVKWYDTDTDRVRCKDNMAGYIERQ